MEVQRSLYTRTDPQNIPKQLLDKLNNCSNSVSGHLIEKQKECFACAFFETSVIFRKKNETLRYFVGIGLLGNGSSKTVNEYWDVEKKKSVSFGKISNNSNKGSLLKEFEILKDIKGKSSLFLRVKFLVDSTVFGIATEKCEGTLVDLPKEVLSAQKNSIIRQLVQGIADFHKLGYVHRDLKPENIFFLRDPEGNVKIKIADFDFACKVDQITGSPGTPIVYSPEIGKSILAANSVRTFFSSSIDYTKSDVWALGLLCYELYTGIRIELDIPKKESILESLLLLANHLQDLKDVQLNDSSKEAFVIEGMLRVDPVRRFSAEEALNGLDWNL